MLMPSSPAPNRLTIGGLHVTFHRTLRVPDDGTRHDLPAGLGEFPVRNVDDYGDRVPAAMRATGGVFIPMHQCEAMWINFTAEPLNPVAVKVAAGKVNAVSGNPWRDGLYAGPDSDIPEYIVAPMQRWLDGFNVGDGTIRQFVAVPLGSGMTVEGQVTGREDHGGIQLEVFNARPECIRQRVDAQRRTFTDGAMSAGWAVSDDMTMLADHGPASVVYSVSSTSLRRSSAPMGLGAGGKISQRIHRDPLGLDTWESASAGRVHVHIVNTQLFSQITGEPAPATPITEAEYRRRGIPWYRMYGETLPSAGTPDPLENIRSVQELTGGVHINGAPVRDGGW